MGREARAHAGVEHPYTQIRRLAAQIATEEQFEAIVAQAKPEVREQVRGVLNRYVTFRKTDTEAIGILTQFAQGAGWLHLDRIKALAARLTSPTQLDAIVAAVASEKNRAPFRALLEQHVVYPTVLTPSGDPAQKEQQHGGSQDPRSEQGGSPEAQEREARGAPGGD